MPLRFGGLNDVKSGIGSEQRDRLGAEDLFADRRRIVV